VKLLKNLSLQPMGDAKEEGRGRVEGGLTPRRDLFGIERKTNITSKKYILKFLKIFKILKR
jgi:hypothetical protein